MHLFASLSIIALVGCGASALPAASSVVPVFGTASVSRDNTGSLVASLEKRVDNIIEIRSYSRDSCRGDWAVGSPNNEGEVREGDFTKRWCLPTAGMQSIKYLILNGYYDCKVTAWKGERCDGSGAELQWADVGKCYSAPFNSVSWKCTLKQT